MLGEESETSKDRLFRQPRPQVGDFKFDESVAAVFDDMIARSIPGYRTIVELAGVLAAANLPTGGRCYDLGCSLGATSLAVTKACGDRDVEIIAVDSSAAMIDRARELTTDPRIQFQCADIRDVPIHNASVATLNFVLQFLPPEARETTLARIRDGLQTGGILILSEKVQSDDEFEQLHRDYKKLQGYSELEIAQKRTALENVMKIDSVHTHLERLESCGFWNVRVWFSCLNWVSIVASR